MANNHIALSVANPEIDAMGAFAEGQNQAARIDMAKKRNAEAALQLIGSASLAAMNGDINGQADPQKFDGIINDLVGMGVKEAADYRGRPDVAPVLARASMTALQQLGLAQNEREFDLALKKYDLAVEKLNKGVDRTSLSGVWGKDAQGNPVYLQPTTSGTFVQAQAPEGVSLTPGIKTIDTGTGTALIDTKGGMPQGFIPKDLAGAEAEKASGKARGEALVSLPADLQRSEQTVQQIDELLNNQGFDTIFGAVDQYRPAWTMGAAGRDALARYNQLKGKAFLEAYGMLKGGGQITEVEGQKAQDAMARLDRAQDETAARQALMDFRDAVVSGAQKLREKAGQSSAASASPGGGQSEVTSKEQYDALPSGAVFTSNGKRYRKP